MVLLEFTLEGLLADEKEARLGDSSLGSSEIACPGAYWTAAVQIHWLCLPGSQVVTGMIISYICRGL